MVDENVNEQSKDGIKAVIKNSVFLGLNTHYFVELETGEAVEIIQESLINHLIPSGSEINLTINKDKSNVFDKETTLSLMEGISNNIDNLSDSEVSDEH